MVGDIYLGRVARVLPGIRAAFIDIGLKHDAFLHFSDIGDRTHQLQEMLGEEIPVEDEDEQANSENKKTNQGSHNHRGFNVPKLRKGQEIIVQITKEPVNNKGVRVTSSVSLPGRFCVLLPYDNKIGISKKIIEFRERRRLRYIARSILAENYGLIIRTVARSQSEQAVKDDLQSLKKTWREIEENAKSEKPPSLIYQDMSTTSSVIRDLFNSDVSKVFIDSKKSHKEIKNYLKIVQPAVSDKIEHYKSHAEIFEDFKIDEQINSLMGRKVSLPSGGYLIIEHTEAMYVIDVNSGRYARSKEQELNSGISVELSLLILLIWKKKRTEKKYLMN